MFLLLSLIHLDPGSKGTGASSVDAGSTEGVAESDVETLAEGTQAAPGADVSSVDNRGATATTLAKGPQAAACNPRQNGGATDKGVTATKIRVATTAVLDGAAKSLLADSVTGMKAVIDKVNRAGGICGRLIDLTVNNDSFSDRDGLQYLRNFMEEGYFALPVVPSAEGLGSAIQGGWIDRAGIPVVGTDGMRQEQYGNPWVWPVASATVTAMRVMAKYGFEKKGARKFAIVWDEKYQFGREGKDAFVKQVQAMGGEIVADQPLDPTRSSYANEVNTFNGKCGGEKCDMVALLLLPDTAEKWIVRQPAKGRLYTAGAQTLFTDGFAKRCVQVAGDDCNGIAVWTGYNPPIGALRSKPGIAQYVSDVTALNPTIDVNNQFLEGAYLGMSVFVEALRRTGPNLTRARLRDVMDSMAYESDLTSMLSWKPGKHAANVRSQSFAMVVGQGTFTGWRDEGTGFLLDPAHGG